MYAGGITHSQNLQKKNVHTALLNLNIYPFSHRAVAGTIFLRSAFYLLTPPLVKRRPLNIFHKSLSM